MFYWTDRHQIFQKGRHMERHDQYDLLPIAQWVTDLGANGRKLAYPPSFGALAFHNGWKDRKMDIYVNTANDPCTSLKI